MGVAKHHHRLYFQYFPILFDLLLERLLPTHSGPHRSDGRTTTMHTKLLSPYKCAKVAK